MMYIFYQGTPRNEGGSNEDSIRSDKSVTPERGCITDENANPTIHSTPMGAGSSSAGGAPLNKINSMNGSFASR